MKSKVFVLMLSAGIISSNISNAKFISEISLYYTYYSSRTYEICSAVNYFSGGGILIDHNLNETVNLFSGINYMPAKICGFESTAHYINIPAGIKWFFYKNIFIEPCIELRWLSNYQSEIWKSDINSANVEQWAVGYKFAVGFSPAISKNISIPIKAFLSNGLSGNFNYRTVDPLNLGGEVGLALLF